MMLDRKESWEGFSVIAKDQANLAIQHQNAPGYRAVEILFKRHVVNHKDTKHAC